MSYLLILKNHLFLPHAVRLEAETIALAMSEIADRVDNELLASPQWLIELATGDVRRVFKSGDQVILSDTAFRSDLGEATGIDFLIKEKSDQVDYFLKPESAEAQSCD